MIEIFAKHVSEKMSYIPCVYRIIKTLNNKTNNPIINWQNFK